MPSTQVLATAGSSSFEVEEPDLMIYRLRGTLQASELRTLRNAEWLWNEGKPHLLVIIDICGLDGVTMEARRMATQPSGGTTNRAMAMVGGSRHIQALANLIMKGVKLLSGGSKIMRFFDDEASAREWLYSQRAVLQAQV